MTNFRRNFNWDMLFGSFFYSAICNVNWKPEMTVMLGWTAQRYNWIWNENWFWCKKISQLHALIYVSCSHSLPRSLYGGPESELHLLYCVWALIALIMLKCGIALMIAKPHLWCWLWMCCFASGENLNAFVFWLLSVMFRNNSKTGEESVNT